MTGERRDGDGAGPLIVVMGVSAAGKSTVGAGLARELAVRFVDADDLHTPANRAKMAAGIPLDDADRGPWLDLVGAELARAALASATPASAALLSTAPAGSALARAELAAAGRDGSGLVIACSALRRAYRDQLRGHAPETYFLHLDGSPALLAERARGRASHFMPSGLLASQLATLEPLGADEAGARLDVAEPVASLIADAALLARPPRD